MNKTTTIIIIALAVIVGGYFLFGGGYQTSQDSGTQTPSLGVPAPGFESVPETVVVPDGEGSGSSDENIISGSATREINMVSGNLFFTPKNLTLTKDQPVKITFQNTGTHTFTIDALGVNVALRGSSSVVEFTPTQSGTFEYRCTIPGHRAGGMFGSLSVE